MCSAIGVQPLKPCLCANTTERESFQSSRVALPTVAGDCEAHSRKTQDKDNLIACMSQGRVLYPIQSHQN